MKFKISKEELVNGLQTTQNVVSSKTTLPILMNILIKTEKNQIRISATDLDMGISCLINADIEEAGAITIPAKKTFDIIKELPNNDILITVKKNHLVIIECGKSLFKIIGIPETEFPELPDFSNSESIQIDKKIIKEMLDLTYFAVSRDETRYILNGILFVITKENLQMVATDGRRLACITKDLPKEVKKIEKKIVIPIKTVQELLRLLGNEGEITLYFGNNQIMFQVDGVIITSRLIEGEYPDYTQVIPKQSGEKIEIDKTEFLSATKRASLLTNKTSQAINLNVLKNRMVISKNSPELGEVKEELDVKYPGDDMTIGFNPNYIMDVLKNIEEDNVSLELTSSEKPGVIRTQDRYIYVILPMQI